MPKNLAKAVTYHAWNKDRTMVALSPNTHEVFIYESNGSEDHSKWTKKYTLDEHTGDIAGIDWS
eukprot:CAMPEP_0183366784 /NCGR_PEP_ID=MMETSP0164_2-20130417/90059_1 /TAXON_ID=221442 /ORGANISM="Coccolithus pelagicus ssp braarudi, Strain PLY182g" /LENGTH=63 /DNA_ID=CAMNT_0025542587 /DNA_START=13 /DNA_END=201 /DNA_ORIENTATION=-